MLTAALWRAPVMGHVGVVGHVATAAALGPVLGSDGWFPVAVSALFAGAWLVTTAAQETVGSPVTIVFERVTPRHGGAIAPVLAIASLPFVAVAALVAVGAFPDHPESRLVVPFAVAAVIDAALARLLVDRVRLTTITARAAFAFALLGAVGGSDDRVGVVCAVLAVVSIAVLPTTRRTLVMVWTGWALTALVVVRVGLVADLDADGLRIVLFAWAAGLTVGVLGYLRRSGTPRAALQPRFTEWWTPPLVLGLVASIAAVETAVDAAGAAHPDTAGWWLLAAAALTLVWAFELAEPTVTYVSDALAAAALTLLLPWSLPGEPWGLFAVGLALTAVAIALALALPPTERAWWRRWDMPPFVVANVAAVAVVALAEFSDAPPAVYAAVGGWALGVGAWRRHWAWLGAAVVLLDTSAGRAGPGWLALALALTAVAAVVVALRARASGAAGSSSRERGVRGGRVRVDHVVAGRSRGVGGRARGAARDGAGRRTCHVAATRLGSDGLVRDVGDGRIGRVAGCRPPGRRCRTWSCGSRCGPRCRARRGRVRDRGRAGRYRVAA